MRQLRHGGIQAWKRCMSLAQRCANMSQLKAIHAVFITHGIHLNNYAISKLIAFSALSDSGDLSYASLIFNQIETPNTYIYNTLLRAYSRSSKPHLALRYFQLMLKTGDRVICDHCTFHFVLLACVNGAWVLEGQQIHNWVVKNGLALLDGHVQTAIVRLYVECKVMDDARKVFDEVPQRDHFRWNVLMDGYIRCGLASEALRVFQDMLAIKFVPDEYCAATALTACTHLGALWDGKLIHEYVKNMKAFDSDVFIGTALVDMYAKCGCLDVAVEVFENMPKRNVFSWAAMIGGFAAHGHARKAIHCLKRMQLDDKIRPDGVVLLGVLTACTHAGLQKEGPLLLDNMKSRYGILPKHEHYSCVVDLLCRAGKLKEAHELIRKMPMKPLASVWGALLSGCRIHNNVDLAELAVKELLLLENGDKTGEDGVYVQLSNIYLAAQRREDAIRIRKMIGDRGIRKTPGCSMIEVDGKMNEFISGDIKHSCRVQICAMMDLLSSDSVQEPYVEFNARYHYLQHGSS
ncbi:Tetratricopeptide-like helical domain containing protein [Parasponia andersonii]|uniref:Tetratricopeptide-like helical domain containing protein n=1 Tax=Parasponia andersonii TaxID=3476 RepID=A0A2P5CEK1_PARAD|nr:Tetratricopeptide-like helical domain containing protein [Parasponia andersonii]